MNNNKKYMLIMLITILTILLSSCSSMGTYAYDAGYLYGSHDNIYPNNTYVYCSRGTFSTYCYDQESGRYTNYYNRSPFYYQRNTFYYPYNKLFRIHSYRYRKYDNYKRYHKHKWHDQKDYNRKNPAMKQYLMRKRNLPPNTVIHSTTQKIIEKHK